MKVYVDLLLIINFFIDLILLLSVSIILKRKINYYRLVFSSFLGSLSIILLFFNITSLTLFLFKMIISILMVIIAFKFKNLKYFLNNLLYLYINSIILGGFLYFINFNLSNYLNSYFINLAFLIILSPLIIYIYLKQIKKLKNNYNNYYPIDIYLNNNKYHFIAYFDSGNNLTYKNNPVIIINKNKIKIDKYNLMPYQVLNHVGLLKITKIDKLIINNIEYKKLYLGLSDDEIKIDGVDVLLNNKIGGIL